MGKQPQFVECVDFRPLIDPIADVNFNDYNPVRSTNSRAVLKTRRRGNDQCIDINDSDNAPSAKRKPPQSLIMKRFMEPMTSHNEKEVQNKTKRQWEFDIGEESSSSEDSVRVVSQNIQTESTSSTDSDQALVIYIPKFKNKRKKRLDSSQIIIRTLKREYRLKLIRRPVKVDKRIKLVDYDDSSSTDEEIEKVNKYVQC
jgi:hypothetical protein